MDDHFTTTRESLSTVHEGLLAIAERRESTEALQDLAAAQARLAATSFRLVFLGEYKRGKSTLINALLGMKVLPMDVMPLTSVVTEVRHGPHPSAQIEFLDGCQTTIPIDEMPSFVTEPGNPRNRKAVRRAVVQLRAPLLQAGVTIVDTPGVGSVLDHNTEVTYDFLAESDAVVIVLAADQPLSAEERRLLESLAGITDHVLFAVNRIDVLASQEVAKSMEFIRQNLAELENAPPEHVYPLSAKVALERGTAGEKPPDEFIAFSDSLSRQLVGRKSDILMARATRLTRRAADLLSLDLALERHALGRDQQQLQDTIERLESAAVDTAGTLERSTVLLRHEVQKIQEVALRHEADRVRARLLGELWQRVESSLQVGGSAPFHRRVDGLAVSIGEWVVDDLKHVHQRSETTVRDGLGSALEAHMSRVNAATADLVAVANGLLGMRAAVPEVIAPLDERTGFYFKDWDYAGGSLRVPGWLLHLPRRWAEPRARWALRELLERRINQNLEAIRYDWFTRLNDAVRRCSRSSTEQLDGIVRLVKDGLRRAERIRAEGESERRGEELTSDLDAVNRLRATLGDPRGGRTIAARTERG